MEHPNEYRLVIVGGGGHALVVAEAALAAGWIVAGFLDDNPGATIAGRVPRLGSLTDLERSADRGRAHLAIGDLAARARLIARLGADAATVVHPRAWVSPTAAVGAGVLIGAMGVVQGRASIGDHCIINTGAIVEHDCALGENVHLAPRAVLAGDVRIGTGSLIGAGAVVLPGVRVGAGVTIGAGAVVTKDVSDGVTLVGVPARHHS